MQLPTPAQEAERDRLDREIAAVRKVLDTPSPELAAAQRSWEKTKHEKLPPRISSLLALAGDKCTDADRAELAAYYRSIAPALEPERAKLAELERTAARLKKQIPTTLITVAVTPRTIRLLHRGNWMDETGGVMHPAFPEVLSHFKPHQGRLTRADLARWLTSPENPLTARTFVNRMWKLAFGARALAEARRPGRQGEWPSHPHLLDWLAGQFIDSGWNVKHVIKLIVMSGTYRQSSKVTPELREADPDNRWLARQGRFRIDAEMVRDNALKISGLLVERIGGPSVKPYQPPGYWSHLNFPPREWENGSGDQLYRRSLYTHWQRQYLHPAMLAFNAPGREECTADRPRSNTPLQSLVLMNDPEFIEAARAFGEQILEHGGTTTAQRLDWAFRRALSRTPREPETAVLTKLLATHQSEYPQRSQVGGRTGGHRRTSRSRRDQPRRVGGLDECLPHDSQPARNDHPQLRPVMMLPPRIGRRTFVRNTGVSLGSMALASVMPRTKPLQAAITAQHGRAVESLANRRLRRGPSGSSGSTWPAA